MQKVYAANTKDIEIRKASSSGGLFSIFAQSIFKQNGIVYGVAMTEDCYKAEFVRVEEEKDLELLKGSKYLQAMVKDSFKSVKKDLQEDKIVLFTGTACQINGLVKFLGKPYENLYCIDVICHGVPSYKIWKKSAQAFEENAHSKIFRVNFRAKDQGWKNYGLKRSFVSKEEIYIPMNLEEYMLMYLKNYSLRPSCYDCVPKKNKLSDMTIGDFWGIENVLPDFDCEMGASLIIVRNEKGSKLLEQVKEEINIKEADFNSSIQYNPSEYMSPSFPKQRKMFYEDLEELRYSDFLKKYTSSSIKMKLKRLLKTKKSKGE